MAELEALIQEVEELVSSECKSLLQSLPLDKGWMPFFNLHLFHGFWYPTRTLNGVLSVQKNFRSNPSDIFLTSFPKSGTTWLMAIVFAIMNRDDNHHNHPLLQNNPHDLVPFLENRLFLKDSNPDLSSFAAPRLFATHIPFSLLPTSLSQCKIVYLCRNPMDTVVSLWHFSNRITKRASISLEEAVDNFCRGVSMYGPFWDHVLEYWKASQEMPDNVLFLKYEEIKEQPNEQLRKLADFLGCPFSQEDEMNCKVEEISKMCSFESLSGLQVNMTGKVYDILDSKVFFRQGKVGDSANYLTEEMIHRIHRIMEEKLIGSTLKLL